jgi:hypothetical protein
MTLRCVPVLALLLLFTTSAAPAGSASPAAALDRAFDNLYGTDVLAGVRMVIEEVGSDPEIVEFGYGRKRTAEETRTLLFLADPRGESLRALLLQRRGENDQIYLSNGRRGRARPVTASQRRPMFGSDFSFEDFRSQSSDEFDITRLGDDRLNGEDCQVLELRPRKGAYQSLVVWLSKRRPVFLRVDYFDKEGLWKRYRARASRLVDHFGWWVAMEDEMLDLRSGRRTKREIRNVIVDAAVPDELFTIARLTRGRMPSF